MTVQELIDHLLTIENKQLQVVYGHEEYDNIQYSETFLWAIDNPKYDEKHGETVVNIGSLSNGE